MIDQPRLAIVGAGPRASFVARALCRQSLVGDLVLIDPTEPSHARIEHADLFRLHAPIGPVSVRATGYEALHDVPLVLVALEPGEADAVTAAGTPLLELIGDALDRNAPDAVVVVATEPSEGLTARLHACSARPNPRILGLGTLPDTLCLRDRVASHLRVDPDAVDLQVVGWHGTGAVPLWSRAQIGGRALIGAEVAGIRLDATVRERLTAACREQATHHAGLSTEDARAVTRIVHAILKNTHAVLTVAACIPDDEGFDDVPPGNSVSMPCVVGEGGVESVLLPPLTNAERATLRQGRPPRRSAGLPGHTRVASKLMP